ncbi:MAG: carbamoyl-phosphate synthase large subunit [Spirochaetes bacterium]|nr:MAG: carbamoyl-phosphate synthase large subunit [Spirochaetota bacterium]
MKTPKSVLVLGSGGLKIGQAGEFDYSGSQALKALREEGIRSILINPNIATIQTSEGMADATYFLPLTPEYVKKVIEKERPEGIFLSFGGQTALNCGMELYDEGVFYKHGVEVLGTPVEAIRLTEDRELFANRLKRIGAFTPRSIAALDQDAAVAAAEQIGYPVMLRAAFALGGAGSGLCRNEAQLITRCAKAFSLSPQVLVEEWLGGWKEIEYEVVRDSGDNCITVCNMENFDPLGIHTGESIVVAPSQTLTDEEYHGLRSVALKVIRSIGIVGECNIQYALDPRTSEYRIIEVNARLSRSSALASKATGYPLAYVAAKLALGKSLAEIPNQITRVTASCFEPALDYCVVKIPRWDLSKFKEVDTHLGSEMKSVGEVMGIGRNFEEALQKALRMTGMGYPGLSRLPAFSSLEDGALRKTLREPTDKRIFAVYEALSRDWSVSSIHRLTAIDPWFLHKIEKVRRIEAEIIAAPRPLARKLLLSAKKAGFSDSQIGVAVETGEKAIRVLREHYRLFPQVRQIDTLAAEFPAETNYLYMTYSGEGHDIRLSSKGVMVPGSGPYRIGSSVEFDWCCVNAIQTARSLGRSTIMVNCNPETVSTDYDVCDRLYFEELSLERILDIYEFERPEGMILSMGGQIPNTLATRLFEAGAVILGTSPESIDRAEDRHKFSSLLDELDIDQPEWRELTTLDEAKGFAAEVSYPVLVRPSYVLSGAAMNVAWDEASLSSFLALAKGVSPDHPVVISKFIENSKEIEVDAVARHGKILYNAITEHIENAGVHSGDATVVLPAQRLYIETIRRIRRISAAIAQALRITGPFNIQFIAQRNKIKVIECNLRASRSFPFCSKVSRVNMIDLATRAILDEDTGSPPASALDLPWVGVKAAQFSFSRLHGADPVLGVEMASTGEVGCIGPDLDDAFLKAMLSVGYRIPKGKILLSTGPLEDKIEFLESAKRLADLGLELWGTGGTYRFLRSRGIECRRAHWPLEKKEPNIATMLQGREFDLVINVPKNNETRELKNDYAIRRAAVDYNIPLFTNIKVAKQFIDALVSVKQKGMEIKPWEDYR